MKRELEETKTSCDIPSKQLITDDNIRFEGNTEHVKRDKLKKKQKLIMIVGYNGLDFIGSQKQPTGVRTVEREIENTLYKLGFIAESNYGTLQKICFTRATRTDKKVHALQNFFSCKFLLDPEIKDLKVYKEMIKSEFPKDIRLFSLLGASKRFNSKLRSSSREYLYYLPSFCLYNNDKSPKVIEELLESLNKMCEIFKGTHKFHNYTKGIGPNQSQACRNIFDMTAKTSFTLNGIEFIEFFIKGQSFLYNQIRKMIGMIISVCRRELPIETIGKSFSRHEVMTIPLAPGEGLILNRVLYDKYNKMKGDSKIDVVIPEEDKEEIEKFKKELIECIVNQELEKKAFSNWIKEFDAKENKEEDDKDYQVYEDL